VSVLLTSETIDIVESDAKRGGGFVGWRGGANPIVFCGGGTEVGILKTTLGIPIITTLLSEVGILKTTPSNFSTFRYIFHACNFFQQLLGQNY
jgi:hypothetical protein